MPILSAIDELKGGILTLDMDEDSGTNNTFVIERCSTKISFKSEGEIPNYDIDINVEGFITELEDYKEKLDEKGIKELQDKYAEMIKTNVDAVINEIKNVHTCDVFGFGNLVYKQQPKLWEKIEDRWFEEIYPQSKINVKATVAIRNINIKK